MDCSGAKLFKINAVAQRSLEDFEILKNENGEEIILGKGAYSEVKLVKEAKSGEKFAMKMVGLIIIQN